MLLVELLLTTCRILWERHCRWLYSTNDLRALCCCSWWKFCLGIDCRDGWACCPAERADSRHFLSWSLLLHCLEHHWLLVSARLLMELRYQRFLYHLGYSLIWLILSVNRLICLVVLHVSKLLRNLGHDFFCILNRWMDLNVVFLDLLPLLLILNQAHS